MLAAVAKHAPGEPPKLCVGAGGAPDPVQRACTVQQAGIIVRSRSGEPSGYG